MNSIDKLYKVKTITSNDNIEFDAEINKFILSVGENNIKNIIFRSTSFQVFKYNYKEFYIAHVIYYVKEGL